MKKVIYLSLLLALSNSHIEANKLPDSSKSPPIEANKSQGLATKKLSTSPSTSPLMNCSNGTPQCTTLSNLLSDLNAISNSVYPDCSSCTPPNCDAMCTILDAYITQLTNSQLTEEIFCNVLGVVCGAYGFEFGALSNVCPPNTPLPSICTTTQMRK